MKTFDNFERNWNKSEQNSNGFIFMILMRKRL